MAAKGMEDMVAKDMVVAMETMEVMTTVAMVVGMVEDMEAMTTVAIIMDKVATTVGLVVMVRHDSFVLFHQYFDQDSFYIKCFKNWSFVLRLQR